MDTPAARLTLMTLCVSDLARSTAFYEALGFRRKARGAEGVAFFDAGGVILSLWPAAELAKDAGIAIERPAGLSARVARLELRLAGGGRCRPGARGGRGRLRSCGKPQKVFWGGYTAYFADPDGHIWEIAHNPGFPLSEDGRLTLPIDGSRLGVAKALRLPLSLRGREPA